MYARRREISEELTSVVGFAKDKKAREMFLEAFVESIALPYRVANALEAEVEARLREARSVGKAAPELEAEAEETRREARKVRERATARLVGDDVLGPLLSTLQRIY